MGKKYIESVKLIDRSALYTPSEALELSVKTAKAKFDETVELHVRLGEIQDTQINKLEEQLYYHTVLVKLLEF